MTNMVHNMARLPLIEYWKVNSPHPTLHLLCHHEGLELTVRLALSIIRKYNSGMRGLLEVCADQASRLLVRKRSIGSCCDQRAVRGSTWKRGNCGMKLGLINSAWAQAGRDTAWGIQKTKDLGFDTIDIFTDPLDIDVRE